MLCQLPSFSHGFVRLWLDGVAVVSGLWRSDIEVDAGVFGVGAGEVGEGGGIELIVDGVLEGSEECTDATAAGGAAGAAACFPCGL
jgi:hypothetical protein